MLDPIQTAKLEKLWRDHHDYVLRRVRSRGSAYVDHAEDAVSRTFMIAARHIDRIDDTDPRGYLFVIACREALRLIRGDRGTNGILRAIPNTEDFNPDLFTTRHGDPHTHLEYVELLEHLAALRPQRRAAMTARMAGYSYAEHMERTGTTYTNVNKHTTRGRRELAEALGWSES